MSEYRENEDNFVEDTANEEPMVAEEQAQEKPVEVDADTEFNPL